MIYKFRNLKGITLVRHGRTEQNEAIEKANGGDTSLFTEEFRNRSAGNHRLTDAGIRQAKTAGETLRRFFRIEDFDGFFVSPYIRTMETVYHMGFGENKLWLPDNLLRERGNGEFEYLTKEEIEKQYKKDLDRSVSNPIFSRSTNGESMADVELRLRAFLQEVDQTGDFSNIIMVVHSRVMWTLRMIFENLREDEIGVSSVGGQAGGIPSIQNGQILQYSKTDNHNPSRFNLMRSITPGIPFDVGWKKIRPLALTLSDMRKLICKHPRLY